MKFNAKSSNIDIFSFFSGAGFLDLGFENQGYRVVYVNDIHEPFVNAYKYSRSKLSVAPPIYGYDICSIESVLNDSLHTKRISKYISNSRRNCKFVGFIGGPPCPDFSIMGKSRGHLGDNGLLSRSYINTIQLFRPDFFLFENVKGLWQTKKHRTFYEGLKLSLASYGYIMSEQLINAIQYGVPQDRDRIILFGVKKDFVSKDMIKSPYYISNDVFNWSTNTIFPFRTAFEYKWPKTDQYNQDSVLEEPKNVPLELTVEYWFRKNKVNEHPNSNNYFQPRAGLNRFMSISEGDDSKKSFKRLHRWRYSPTASYGNNEVHIHPYKPRRISAAEALALQSLPDSFILPESMSLTNMFKAIGNGVPYLASRGIASTIRSFLEDLK